MWTQFNRPWWPMAEHATVSAPHCLSSPADTGFAEAQCRVATASVSLLAQLLQWLRGPPGAKPTDHINQSRADLTSRLMNTVRFDLYVIAIGPLLGVLLFAAPLGWYGNSPRQVNQELRAALVAAVAKSRDFPNRFAAEVWLKDMSTR